MPAPNIVAPDRPETPLSVDFKRQLKKKQEQSNYHSSSLSTGNMINASNVNKTNLHPGGVEYSSPPLRCTYGTDR